MTAGRSTLFNVSLASKTLNVLIAWHDTSSRLLQLQCIRNDRRQRNHAPAVGDQFTVTTKIDGDIIVGANAE